MLFKICQSCKKPFKAGNSLHIKFCSAECLDNAYVNGRLDQETIDHASRLLKEDIVPNAPRERERERDKHANPPRALFSRNP